jgi:hypothetical protein
MWACKNRGDHAPVMTMKWSAPRAAVVREPPVSVALALSSRATRRTMAGRWAGARWEHWSPVTGRRRRLCQQSRAHHRPCLLWSRGASTLEEAGTRAGWSFLDQCFMGMALVGATWRWNSWLCEVRRGFFAQCKMESNNGSEARLYVYIGRTFYMLWSIQWGQSKQSWY